jgi:hypothetical protein
MKSGMQTYFFLASYAFRSKGLVLVIVKTIRDPRSGIRKKLIPDPDPGVKKQRIPDPDQQHCRNILFIIIGTPRVVHFGPHFIVKYIL